MNFASTTYDRHCIEALPIAAIFTRDLMGVNLAHYLLKELIKAHSIGFYLSTDERKVPLKKE